MHRLLLLLCVFVILILGCNVPLIPVDARFVAGHYRGEAEGHGGTLAVEVEVSGQRILGIKVLSHNESPGISDPAFKSIPVAVLESQGLDVDAVSGCTVTSRALVRAIGDAVAAGCLDRSVLAVIDEEEAPVLTQVITREADMVVIGAGGAGLTAAVEALRQGASVLVLEKEPAVGGNTLQRALTYERPASEAQRDLSMTPAERAAVRELLALDPVNDRMKTWQETLADGFEAYMKDEEALYLYDSAALFKLQAYVGSDYTADPELIEVLGNGLGSGKVFFDDLGVRWTGGARTAMGTGWRRTLTPNGAWGSAGASFVLPQLTYMSENGGEVLTGMRAEEQILTDGRVTGVRGSSGNTTFEVTAHKGVVLATGGYSANADMIKAHNLYWPDIGSVSVVGSASLTGDGLVLAGQAQAAIIDTTRIVLSPLEGEGSSAMPLTAGCLWTAQVYALCGRTAASTHSRPPCWCGRAISGWWATEALYRAARPKRW